MQRPTDWALIRQKMERATPAHPAQEAIHVMAARAPHAPR